jgi:hypothetical protein
MQITTWLLAREDEAEAIASIVTTEEHSPEEWTHIEFPLIEMDLMVLAAVVQEDEELVAESIVEEPLVWDDEGMGVMRVKDSFIQALAGVAPESIPGVVEAWAEELEGDENEPAQLREMLSTLADFAREAVARRSPVLQFVTL